VKYMLFWLDKSTTLVEGEGIADAFTRAGFGGGAVRALDYWKPIEVIVDGEEPTSPEVSEDTTIQ